jgi:hypothetical protein
MSDKEKKAPKKAAKKELKLVKMIRDDGKEASVHPDMVQEYKKGNYKEA